MKQIQEMSDSQALELLTQIRNSAKRISLLNRVKSLKYRFWLASLRETVIIRTLTENYEKIPARTPSKLIAWLFVNISVLKNLNSKLEKKLRENIY